MRTLAYAVVFAALASALSVAASASEIADCLKQDVAALSLIEEQGEAGLVSSERLYAASLIRMQAQNACLQGRDNDARALYDFVATLSPISTGSISRQK